MSIKDKSAFPCWKVEKADQGMNIREKFSESSMIGILSNKALTDSIIIDAFPINSDRSPFQVWTEINLEIFFKEVSRMSVEMADALIAELEKTKEKKSNESK